MIKKAVIAGHICLDVTPVFPDQKVKNLEDILMPGKLIHMKGIDIHTGGAVANTGLAMKLLGAHVKLLGKIGEDEFGKLVLDIMRQNGYDGEKDMIKSEENTTSYSIVQKCVSWLLQYSRIVSDSLGRPVCLHPVTFGIMLRKY